MLISEMKLHLVAIADAPLRSSYGLHAPYALRTIVELHSTDGLTGISETYGGEGPLAALETARPYVTGMDPFQLTGFWQCLNAGDAEDWTKVAAVPPRPTWCPARIRLTGIRAPSQRSRWPAWTSSAKR